MMEPEHKSPPRWAERLLEWYCRPELLEDLQGDLNEFFYRNTKEHGLRWAQIQYVIDVLKFLRPYLIKSPKRTINTGLYFNYSKTAYRNVVKNPFHVSLNVLSLALGLSVFVLITFHVFTELSFDRHFENHDKIYRVTMSWHSEADMETTQLGWSLASLPDQLRYSFSDVETATGIAKLRNRAKVLAKATTFLENEFYETDTSYFKIFSYEWIYGNPVSAAEYSSVVLTETISRKYFGEIDPVGESIEINDQAYTISGVIKDVPINTSLRFKALLFTLDDHTTDWCFTFFKLSNPLDFESFQQRLDTLFEQEYASILSQSKTIGAYHLESLTDIHLGERKMMDSPKGERSTLVVLVAIALIVVAISLTNYMNLTISFLSKRQKEIGIRSVLGAQRTHERTQSIIESFWIVLASFILASLLFLFVWRFVDQYSFSTYFFRKTDLIKISLFIIFSLLFISLITGIVIYHQRSGNQTLRLLKVQTGFAGNRNLRSAMVVLQFTVCLALVFGSNIISDQMILISNSWDKTYKNQLLVIDLPQNEELSSALNQFNQEILQLSYVSNSSFAGPESLPTKEPMFDIFSVDIPGGRGIRNLPFVLVDENYFDVLGLSIISGRSFNNLDMDEGWDIVMVNEAFVKSQGWTDDPLNHTICYGGFCEGAPIVGVVRDLSVNGVGSSEPMLYYPNNRLPERLIIKLSKVDNEIIRQLKDRWKTIVKSPFEYRFLDDYLREQLRDNEELEKQVYWFSLTAISIAAIGLLGLISINLSQRKKDTAIRRVFGAQITDLLFSTWTRYLLLILPALVLAYPLTFIFMNHWLSQFSLQTAVTFSSYLKPIILIIIILAIILSYHAVRLHRTKALDSIRYE